MELIEEFMQRILPLNDYPFGAFEMHMDINGKLHHQDLPALRTPDKAIWYYHGRKHGREMHKDGSVKYYFDDMLIPNSVNPFMITKRVVYQLREGLI